MIPSYLLFEPLSGARILIVSKDRMIVLGNFFVHGNMEAVPQKDR